MAKDGKLVYRLAASRDGEEGKARTYVQHLIEQDSKKIYELVHNKKAWVYISGYALVTHLWDSADDSFRYDPGLQTRCRLR
jgi:hypothetical protein